MVISCLAVYGYCPSSAFFGAFFDTAEQDFWGVGGRNWAMEDVVVCFQDRWGRLTVGCTQLIKYVEYSHSRVPSPYVWVVRHFEGIVDACVEGRKACTFDVLHQ